LVFEDNLLFTKDYGISFDVMGDVLFINSLPEKRRVLLEGR